MTSFPGKKDISWGKTNRTAMSPNQESKQAWGANLSLYNIGGIYNDNFNFVLLNTDMMSMVQAEQCWFSFV
jgi:hypothetical protein